MNGTAVTIVKVCIPLSGCDHYDYACPDAIPELGARVRITLRHRKCVGVVVGIAEHSLFQTKLKPIVSIIDKKSLIDEQSMTFYQWISQYYHAPLSSVMNFVLPKLVKEGRLETKISSSPIWRASEEERQELTLNQQQRHAVDAILQHLDHFHCYLIHGVTGSGKTEVYLQVIRAVLVQGKQVLVLVPEIGLTPQLIARFRARLHASIGVMHSHLSPTERFQMWRQGADGQLQVLLGTRSALLTPLPNLGLIIVDEEHDLSFKQQDRVRYSARDAAIVRAKLMDAPIMLGSATPSLETYLHAQNSKYTCFKLTERAAATRPIHYDVVDLRAHPTREGLTAKTLQCIESHLHKGYQVLVFVNRRGYAPVLFCQACGWMADCSACERHLTVHQKSQQLICHHCGAHFPLSPQCSRCHSSELVFVGVGTQRLFQSLHKRFPNVAMAQIDRDTLKKKQALEAVLEQIAHGKIQLMVGTQLLAKGHHFPRLSLVVVVDADSGLFHQDFRAVERLGQMILQVAGRAGREDIPGEVLIQTHFPNHPLLSLLLQRGYDAFAQALLVQRKTTQLPPYVHLCLIRAKGKQSEKVEQFLVECKHRLGVRCSSFQAKIYGPAPSIMMKKAGFYQWQICVMAVNRGFLHDTLQNLLLDMEKIPSPGVKWSVDVDPLEI